MKSDLANKAHCANTPEQTALMTANTWCLCLNSWSLDSRLGKSFVTLTKKKKKKNFLAPHLPLTVNTFHSHHRQHRAEQMRAEHRIHAHLNTKRRFTSSCMYLYHSGMWLQNEHTALNLKVSLPPSLFLSVHPLTCFCRHLGPHQNKNTAGHGTMCECEAALDQTGSIFGCALQTPSFKHVRLTA